MGTLLSAHPGYKTFVLRCWREACAAPGGQPAWRFSLHRAGGDRERRGFATVEEMAAYLSRELSEQAGAPAQPALPSPPRVLGDQ